MACFSRKISPFHEAAIGTEQSQFYLNNVSGGIKNLELQDLRDFYLFGADGEPQTFCRVET